MDTAQGTQRQYTEHKHSSYVEGKMTAPRRWVKNNMIEEKQHDGHIYCIGLALRAHTASRCNEYCRLAISTCDEESDREADDEEGSVQGSEADSSVTDGGSQYYAPSSNVSSVPGKWWEEVRRCASSLAEGSSRSAWCKLSHKQLSSKWKQFDGAASGSDLIEQWGGRSQLNGLHGTLRGVGEGNEGRQQVERCSFLGVPLATSESFFFVPCHLSGSRRMIPKDSSGKRYWGASEAPSGIGGASVATTSYVDVTSSEACSRMGPYGNSQRKEGEARIVN
eukprot:6212175-Pleurochrysis_carterae.AAC.3